MHQAQDFRDESAALAALVAPLADADFERETLFKSWTINNVLRHLHVWNIAAARSIEGDEAFGAFIKQLMGGERGRRSPNMSMIIWRGFRAIDCSMPGSVGLMNWRRPLLQPIPRHG